jgi:hypothetical protein
LESKDKIKPLCEKIGIIFVVVGVNSFILAYALTSQIFAFMGIGLTFWGALFFLISPGLFVEGNVLVNTLSSSCATTERIITDLDCNGKGFHIPYPQDKDSPSHSQGLKEMVVFIPKDAETSKPPSLDELAEGKFLFSNPEGILLTPPGLGLLASIEKKSKVDFSKLESAELCKVFPKCILDNYSLAKEISMSAKDDGVSVKISNSIYSRFYAEKTFEKSIVILGCPLISAVACVLAKSASKPVYIKKLVSSPDGTKIEAQFRILQAD